MLLPAFDFEELAPLISVRRMPMLLQGCERLRLFRSLRRGASCSSLVIMPGAIPFMMGRKNGTQAAMTATLTLIDPTSMILNESRVVSAEAGRTSKRYTTRRMVNGIVLQDEKRSAPPAL